MQNLQARIGSAPSALGGRAGQMIELAPGLSAPAFVMRFDRNEEIFAEEEEADFVYKVVSGVVRDVRILADGRRQIGAFHLPGEVFGLECGERRLYTAEAVVDCEVALVRRVTLDKAAEADGTTARALWGLTSGDLLRLQDLTLLLARKTALERVASFLVALAARGDDEHRVDLPMSRSDIADHLGLTIETVSRSFTQLERGGAISIAASRRIVLHDRIAAVQA